MQTKDIVYFGFSERLILELIDREGFNLRLVVTQRDRLSLTMRKLLDVLGIDCRIADGPRDLLNLQDTVLKYDMILIHCFGIIVPKEIYQNIPCFNIHPGDLSDNRGPYPLVWDILMKRKKSVSTLHQLGERIDTGKVISKYEVDIDDDDDIESISQKLDEGLREHLDNLFRYDPAIDYPTVTDGTYRRRVSPEEIMITGEDTVTDIQRKIHAQSRYGGALLDHEGHVFRVSSLVSADDPISGGYINSGNNERAWNNLNNVLLNYVSFLHEKQTAARRVA